MCGTFSLIFVMNFTLILKLKREIMNKLKTLIAASFCLTIFSFNANAEFGVGVAGQFINIDADGSEKPSVNPNSARDTESASVDNKAFIASVFAEYASDSFTIGFEHVPGSADVSDDVKTRKDTETSVSGDATANSDEREFKAQAEIENFNIIYAEVPFYNGLYARLGYAELDVNTQEVASSNGGNYGNTTLDGINYGVGYKSGNWKFAYEITDFDELSLTSTNNSANSGTNTITADLDTWALKLSYGYYF